MVHPNDAPEIRNQAFYLYNMAKPQTSSFTRTAGAVAAASAWLVVMLILKIAISKMLPPALFEDYPEG